MNIKVSIITASFNSKLTIEQTIQSVLNQSYPFIEYIIIDGGSTDGTIDIIKKYSKEFINKGFTYKYISEPDKGIYNAFNKGISLSTGDLIGIINSDDWYESNAVSLIVNNYSNDIGIYHGLLKVYNNDNLIKIFMTFSSELINCEMIQHPTCFVKRDVYYLLGLFNEEYKAASDLDFMVNAFHNHIIFKPVFEIIANFRLGGISSTKLSEMESLKIKRKYGIISDYRYFKFIFKNSIKQFLGYRT